MKPTIARIVHFQPFDPTAAGEPSPPIAAIITAIHSPEDVALAIVTPTGFEFKLDVPFSETPKPGHWNWPPREPTPEPDKRAPGGILPCTDPTPGDIGVLHADGSHEYVKPKGKKKKGKDADSTGHPRDRSSGKFTGGRVVNVGAAFGGAPAITVQGGPIGNSAPSIAASISQMATHRSYLK